MIAETIPGLEKLDSAQKLLLVSELWDSLASSGVNLSDSLASSGVNLSDSLASSGVNLSDSLLNDLDKLHEEYEADRGKVTDWESAKERIRASRS